LNTHINGVIEVIELLGLRYALPELLETPHVVPDGKSFTSAPSGQRQRCATFAWSSLTLNRKRRAILWLRFTPISGAVKCGVLDEVFWSFHF